MKRELAPEQYEALARIMASDSRHVIGVDEVGLGAIAGPLYVAGAVFKKGWGDPSVKDSKKFMGKNADKNRRIALVTKVLPNAIHHTICTATTAEVDKEGLGVVLARLTKQAVMSCLQAVPDSIVVLDGINHRLSIRGTTIISLPEADALVPAVSAASIIAKTARDEVMTVFDQQYPWYGFDENRGYGTAKHLAALEKMGVCPLHRRSCAPVKRAIAKRGPP